MKLIDLLVQELPKRGGWPKGAVECCWFKYEKHLDFFDINGNWNRKPITPFDLTGVLFEPNEGNMQEIKKHEYEAALAESVWNDEGLPPVGCECEFKEQPGKCWQKGVVRYISDHTIVIDISPEEDEDGDKELCFENDGSLSFRPIRTEADCKRIEIAQQLCDTFGNGIKVDEKQGFGKTWLNLYDAIVAGKIKGVTTVPTASQIVHCTEKCSREDAERIVTMLKGEL